MPTHFSLQYRIWFSWLLHGCIYNLILKTHVIFLFNCPPVANTSLCAEEFLSFTVFFLSDLRFWLVCSLLQKILNKQRQIADFSQLTRCIPITNKSNVTANSDPVQSQTDCMLTLCYCSFIAILTQQSHFVDGCRCGPRLQSNCFKSKVNYPQSVGNFGHAVVSGITVFFSVTALAWLKITMVRYSFYYNLVWR